MMRLLVLAMVLGLVGCGGAGFDLAPQPPDAATETGQEAAIEASPPDAQPDAAGEPEAAEDALGEDSGWVGCNLTCADYVAECGSIEPSTFCPSGLCCGSCSEGEFCDPDRKCKPVADKGCCHTGSPNCIGDVCVKTGNGVQYTCAGEVEFPSCTWVKEEWCYDCTGCSGT